MSDFIIILISLYLVILLHELGHYISAKILGFSPLLISVGTGREIINLKKIKIKLIPAGGMVKFSNHDWDLMSRRDKKLIAFFGVLAVIVFGLVIWNFNSMAGLIAISSSLINLIPLMNSKNDGNIIFTSKFSRIFFSIFFSLLVLLFISYYFLFC